MNELLEQAILEKKLWEAKILSFRQLIDSPFLREKYDKYFGIEHVTQGYITSTIVK